MNDQQMEDLKQFIDGRISQSEARFDGRIDDLRQEVESLRQEMLDGFAGVGEAIEEINKQVDERLTKLEQAS